MKPYLPSLIALLVLSPVFILPTWAQDNPELVSTISAGATQSISEHVYYIPDGGRQFVPNVGIVVGDRATLVIDTGLGLYNGQIVLAEAQKVAKSSRFYIAATHTHPEHDLGAMAFPEDAIVVRSRNQEIDIDESGLGLANRFAQMSQRNAELLEGVALRPSDVVFEQNMTLDLGGVHVRLMQAGPAHTRGDVAFYVEEDGVLFTGDVVMNAFPMPISSASSISHWLDTLEELEALEPELIVPSHYSTGSADMIGTYREFFTAVQTRVNALAREGKSAEEAQTLLTEELGARFSQWKDSGRIQRSIDVAYRER